MKAATRLGLVLATAIVASSSVGCRNLPAVGELPFTWTTNADKTITVTGYSGTGTVVTIPGRINGLPVTSLGACAFLVCHHPDVPNLVTVTIPEGITNVGEEAFGYCGSLVTVSIPSSVHSIGSEAFKCCHNLVNVRIPANVVSIGDKAFRGCHSLSNMAIPTSVVSIGDRTFSECSNLTAITVDAGNPCYSSADGVLLDKGQTMVIQCPEGKTGNYSIPNGVTNIGHEAFWSCANLTSVGVPASVVDLGILPFEGCRNLTAIIVNERNPVYGSADGVLFDKRQVTLVECPGGKAGDYMVPSSVVDIGYRAFLACTNLTSVTIPDGVARIGNDAFQECTGLNKVTIPASVTSMGGVAFYGCTSLTNVTVGSSVTRIGFYAFGFCTSVAKITIGPSVTGIDSCAFYGCTNLTGVFFKGNCPSIDGDDAFDGATNATVYYLEGTKGWGPTFGGRPTAVWKTEGGTVTNGVPAAGTRR